MPYKGNQTTLLVHAARYTSLGYKVGFALGKSLVGKYEQPAVQTGWFGMVIPTNQKPVIPDEWDGISLILDDIVCVDFDQDFVDIGWGRPLPPTFKEKSPRGYHLYYRLPGGECVSLYPKVKWKPGVDLLCRDAGEPTKRTKYGEKKRDGGLWGGHVLCNPTDGYRLIHPDAVPPKDQLPIAPDWLLEEIQKS